MMRPVVLRPLLALSLLVPPVAAAEPPSATSAAILPPRQRVEPVNRILRQRLDHVLPALMRETGIDLWLVVSREYAEDPIHRTLVPEPFHSAPMPLAILAFFDRGPEHGVERFAFGRVGAEGFYQPAAVPGGPREQWRRLVELVAERQPRQIGLNVSLRWAAADGLSASLRDVLERVLGPELSQRIVTAEPLAARWLETRTADELELYPRIVALTRSVIADAFSERVITPGVTTTDDVAWYLRERFDQLDVPVWFMPYVNVQRRGVSCTSDHRPCGLEGEVIRRGDVIHADVGACYLRLCSDVQEMGYVLRAGESEPPPGLSAALADGNRFQDLLTASFELGKSGNEVLTTALEATRAAGLEARIYSHPLGYFGHAPGPVIGLWGVQAPVPYLGEWPIHAATVYAIEGSVRVTVPEWDGQAVEIKLEQDAVFDGERVRYLAGRQTRWHLVR